MIPIKFVLGGFDLTAMQQTHTWHIQKITEKQIDKQLTVHIIGNDPSIYKERASFLFHAPLLGGWGNYSVYEVAPEALPFYIGWIVYDTRTNTLREAAVHRKVIRTNMVRLTDGTPHFSTYIFALTADGRQVPIKKVDAGKLGDHRYKQIPLY